MTALNCNRLVAVIAVVICATAAFVVVDALPNGAPASSCQTLAPVHKHGGLKTARTSAAPYTLAVTKLQSGDAYDLKITGHSKAADTIKGFIVQARNKAGKVVGAFVLGPKNDKYTQHLECGSSKQVSCGRSTVVLIGIDKRICCILPCMRE